MNVGVIAAAAAGALALGVAGGGHGEETLVVAVPAGWHGESFVSRSGMPVFRVGSFAFALSVRDDVGQLARAAMRPDDVLINIVDYTGLDPRDDTYRLVAEPYSIDGSKATGQEGYVVPAVIESVLVDGRKLYVSVAFGTAPPSRRQVDAANAVLATVRAS